MASKRALLSIPRLVRLASPTLIKTPSSLVPFGSGPRPHHPSLTLPTTRLAHSIPRPRNGSPFSQQQKEQHQQHQHQRTTTTTTTAAVPSSSSPNTTSPRLDTDAPRQTPQSGNNPRDIRQQPHYELTFTCRPCSTRSRHRVSKHGYHHGTVLIACPQCKNRHVISDHLRIFSDKAVTVEDILRQKGELVKKGTLVAADGAGEDGSGDLEFWDDGTSTERQPWAEDAQRSERIQKQQDDLPPGATFKSVKPGDRKVEN